MNITTFNKIIYPIEYDIDVTLFSLDYDHQFPYETRRNFNTSLNSLLFLLSKSSLSASVGSPSWHTARRIVQLKKIYSKIEDIRRQVFIHCPIPYFAHKIRFDVLPLLGDRIKELCVEIGSLRRLPFAEGSERFFFHKHVKESLQLRNANKASDYALMKPILNSIVKEYFHLLGNYFDEAKVQEIEVETYHGNLEVYSLESWTQVIKLFIKEGNIVEKQIGDLLLSVLQKAIPLSLKTSFALNLPQIMDPFDEADEIAYFQDLSDAFLMLEERENPARMVINFFEKYKLTQRCPIPESVIINEMAWDMLDVIRKMAKGEMHIFLLGVRTHSIAIQVSCLELPTSKDRGVYQYKIFNTGSGVNYHQLDASEEFAYPLTYNNLPEEAFSYSFFSALLRHSLEGRDVNEFYQLHDEVFVNEFGGFKEQESGSLYLLQKWKTCAYSAIEAWIDSFLTTEQKTHLNILKTRMSMQKQEKVVQILQEEASSSSDWMMRKKRKIVPCSQSSADTAKKLRESQLLLTLGQDYLKKVSQPSFIS